MVVLSPKVDEKIMIGDDIVLTLVKIDNNRVRIGISAPKDVHILRGELVGKEIEPTAELELPERQHAFAHPEEQTQRATKSRFSMYRVSESIANDSPAGDASVEPAAPREVKVFTGSVRVDGSQAKLTRHRVDSAKRPAPLASYVAT